MRYALGDKVSFLNQPGHGTVAGILSNFRIIVLNQDGFEVSVSVDEIVPFTEGSKYKIDQSFRGKPVDPGKKRDVLPPRLSADEVWEVDLHLHELTENERFMNDHEKLMFQVRHFKKCMEAAFAHRIRKVIFIHGVGKGTLKQEILHVLKDYTRIRYYDAPYRRYGFGAITVEIL